MATLERERLANVPLEVRGVPNGAALAAYLAAGIGAFAMGLVVLLNEMELLTVPWPRLRDARWGDGERLPPGDA
jgi:hypothetical protein